MNLDRRLLRLTCDVRARFGLAVGLGLLAGLLLVIQAYLLSQAVSRAFLGGADLADLRGWLVGLGIVALIRAVILWGGEVSAAAAAVQIKRDLRARLFDHLAALGPAYVRGERTGELVNTAVEGIEALDAYFGQYIPQLALAALVPLGMLFIVFPLDLLSGVVLLVTAPLIPFFMVLIGSLANLRARRQWATLSYLSAHFLDTLQGLTTLKLFGRSHAQAAVIAQASEHFRAATMSVLSVAFLSALALEMLATISTAVVAVQIGLRLLYRHLDFDEAFFVLILAPEFYLPLRMLGTRFHAGVAGAAAAARIFEVLETPAPGANPSLPVGERFGMGGSNFTNSITKRERAGGGVRISPPEIRFEDVYYAYDGGERPALNGLSFTLAAGQKVALVGPSGAGKSTAMHLLLRFLEPTGGRMTINGTPLSDIPPAQWRAQIAWVPQLPYLFYASAAENIRLARPDASPDDVIRAAQRAGADDFIRALPAGYDTSLGERGARLSGGQAQRIALARAFLKDAPLLLFDEATANLDPETEAQLGATLRELAQGRSVLIIAHRLTTARDADQIVVLDGGRAVEIWTNAELLARGETYAALVHHYAGGA